MMELAFDIASGANYKFNTAFLGEQVRHVLDLRFGLIHGGLEEAVRFSMLNVADPEKAMRD